MKMRELPSTAHSPRPVIPAQAGIQVHFPGLAWIPAFAGMTHQAVNLDARPVFSKEAQRSRRNEMIKSSSCSQRLGGESSFQTKKMLSRHLGNIVFQFQTDQCAEQLGRLNAGLSGNLIDMCGLLKR